MKIIIVEDEKSIRNGLVKMLPKLDPEYEVVGSAKDGSEGHLHKDTSASWLNSRIL